jgi:hypothetical protein
MNFFKILQLHNFCHQISGFGSSQKPMRTHKKYFTLWHYTALFVGLSLISCVWNSTESIVSVDFDGISQNLCHISQLVYTSMRSKLWRNCWPRGQIPRGLNLPLDTYYKLMSSLEVKNYQHGRRKYILFRSLRQIQPWFGLAVHFATVRSRTPRKSCECFWHASKTTHNNVSVFAKTV